ncbi:phage portal protein [Candidatus Parcubacteria bacterium]|nr:phage portal protein [Candidatus Parcubacteria bacterium]
MKLFGLDITKTGKKSTADSGSSRSGFMILGDSRLPVRGKRGPLWEESAVGACIRFASDTFPEAPIHVTKNEGGKDIPIEGHPLTNLVRRPNPFYPGLSLWAGTMLSLIIDGNAYWLKVYSKGQQLVELWYVPHWRIRPWWPSGGSEFITKYIYTVNGHEKELDPSEVVHFRVGLDPDCDGRKGLSRIKAVIQEVLTDAEAAVAAHAMMKTPPIPGAVISPKTGEVDLSEEQQAEIKNKLQALAGQGRGGSLILNTAMDVEFPEIDVEKRAFEKIRGLSAERICAAVGIDPMVVSLPSQNKTYSNYAEAREAAYESFIVPMQRVTAETLNLQLLPEMGNATTEQVGFDLSKVRILQKDLDDLFKRLSEAFKAGWLPRGMAQEIAGVGEPEQGDIYLTDTVGTEQDQAAKRLMARLGEESKRRREAYDELGETDEPSDD